MNEAATAAASSLTPGNYAAPAPPTEIPPLDFDAIRLEDMPGSIRVCEQNIHVNGWMLGGMLISAKKRLPHGSFMDWLKTNTDISQTTANNLMALHNGVQQSPFLAEMKQSAAVLMLALSPAQREHFVSQHDVETMSVRKLRDEIEAVHKAAEERERALAEQANQKQLKIEDLQRDMGTLRQQATAAASQREEAAKAMAEAESHRADAQRANAMYDALYSRHTEDQERIRALERALTEEPVATLTPVEVETIVEVPPPDYERLKEELALATEFAESMEQKAKEAQAELRRQQTSGGDEPEGVGGLRRAAMHFLGKASFYTGAGTSLRLTNASERQAYLQCVDAVQEWCEEARRAFTLIAPVVNGEPDVE